MDGCTTITLSRRRNGSRSAPKMWVKSTCHGQSRTLHPHPSNARNHVNKTTFMSQHPSLKSAGGLVVKRNVLKRFERVALLKKRGQWKAGDRVQGLRKTKADV